MGLMVQNQTSGIQTDAYDFSPLMSEAKSMQFHVVQRPVENSALTWSDYEAAVMECHKASIKDDLCGENPWMDNHIGFACHGDCLKTLDAGTLQKLAADLDLPFHVTSNPRGSFAVYAMAA